MIAAHVENGEAQGGDHEDDRRPGGEPGEHVGRGAGAEGRLGTLSAESAGKVSRASLLHENHADEEQAHDHVHGDDKVEEDVHSKAAFGRKNLGAEEGT